MAALLLVVTLLNFSTINHFLAKRRPPPAVLETDMPSLWEDGAFDRLVARRVRIATQKTRRTEIAIQGQGARKQGLGPIPSLAFFVC